MVDGSDTPAPDQPDLDFFFATVDEEHIRIERNKARQLRNSQWWKNEKGKGICHYCKKRFHPSELTMDHITPVIRGGRSTKTNVVACCKDCNSRKGYHLPVEVSTQPHHPDGQSTNNAEKPPS